MNTTDERLYHKDVFLPDWFENPAGMVSLNYGHHARQEAMSEKYKRIKLPNLINLDDFTVIEIGVTSGRISKLLIRGEFDEHFDICIVVIPGRWFVKTVWLNRWDDRHKELGVSRYERA